MTPQPEHDEEFEPIPHDEGTPEMKASRLGWVQLEEYRGKKEHWVDASEYLARLEEDSPRLRRVNEKLLRDLDEMKNTNAAILAHHERQIVQERKSAYDQAMADAEAKHAQAVAAGDVSGAAKAVNTMKALDAQLANPPAPVIPKRVMSAEDQEAVAEFKRENAEWFGVDPEMTKYAQDFETSLMKSGVPLAERLQKTKEKIQRRFPQEFQDMNNDALDDEPPVAPRAQSAPRQAPGRTPNNTSSVRRPVARPERGSYESLSPIGKRECDRHVAAFPKDKQPKAKASWLKFARSDASLFQ